MDTKGEIRKATAVIAIVIVAVVAGVMGYFSAPRAPVAPAPARFEGTFPIAYVQVSPVESDLDYGGYDIAIDDINEWLAKTGRGIKFEKMKYVSDGTTVKTLEQFEATVAAGAQVVVGISWSSHVAAMMGRANELKVPLISVYSTAAGLAIPNDYIFRIVPTTAPYGALIREYIKKLGMRAAAIAYEKDPFGMSYYEAVKDALTKAGIEIVAEVPLSEEPPKEWTPEFGKIKDAWVDAAAKHGKDKVLIIIPVHGPDGVPAMQALMKYPELGEAWVFMSNAPNTEWIKLVPDICIKTKTTTMQMTHPMNPVQALLNEKLKAKGYVIKPHQLQAYDCTWIAALSILAAGEYKGESFQKWIPVIADSYFGATGNCRLNEAGDRAFVDFTIMRTYWKEPGVADFKPIGYYRGATEEIELTE